MRATSLLVGSLCTLLLVVPVRAQQDFSEIEIETVPVADGIYMLMGLGGNIGLSVGEDGPFLVDDQYAPLSEKISAAVVELSDLPSHHIDATPYGIPDPSSADTGEV